MGDRLGIHGAVDLLPHPDNVLYLSVKTLPRCGHTGNPASVHVLGGNEFSLLPALSFWVHLLG